MFLIKKLKQSELFKNTFIYTILQFVEKAVPFLIFPILTHYLTPKDFGIIATYSTFTGFLGIFIGLSMFGAISVNFFHLNKEELAKYNGSVFNLLIINTFIISLFIYFLQSYLVEKLQLPVIWLYIAVIAAWMRMNTGISLVIWRSSKQAKLYSFYLIAHTLIDALLSLFLIIVLHYHWEGRLIGRSFAAIFLGLLSIIILYKNGYLFFSFSWNYIKDALKFGLPLVPHQLALWLKSGIDIILITTLIGPSQTGLYNVGLQFGMIIGVLVGAFNNAYVPYLYETLKNITMQKKLKLVKFTYLYFFSVIITALILSLISVWIIRNFVDSKFEEAIKYVYLISIAYAFHGMYVIVVNYIFYTKKTHYISLTTITTSILHVILSYFFIKIFGTIGAAYAVMISNFITFILIWKISNKVFPMPWFFWRKK